ncbi:MAG: DUF2190 family protein [Desulfobacteraceae bacterium]|nr:DUF2190 family protein [Desulfobacteraceae bacterium]
MKKPILIMTFVAEAAVAPYRIVKGGTTDDDVLQGAAVTDGLRGVCGALNADAGERVDISLVGIEEVEYGGTIAKDDPITSDANGKAVKAAPAAGVNNRIIGFAMVAGVSGDIGSVLIAPGQIQGA